MKFSITGKILKKIQVITENLDAEAYIVGGYVRDKLLKLKKKSDDIDIMVIGNAVDYAERIASEFGTSLSAVYKNFGTALLNLDGFKIEFASARKESYNRNSRKPIVEYSSFKDDLARRDFTINALAVSLTGNNEVIDLFGGLEHLKDKVIKTPLDPYRTFEDDPLRILRAIRFASVLGFTIEENTFEAIKTFRYRLSEQNVVSQERITNEFFLILKSKKPSIGLNLLFLSGVMKIIFPEIDNLGGVEQVSKYHHKDVFYHTLEVVDNISLNTDDVWLRFVSLVHDIAKPDTKKFIPGTGWTFHGHEELGARMMKKIFLRMRLPLEKLGYVQKLIRMHLRPIPLAKEDVTDSAFRRLAAEAGSELNDLLKLCRADITSKNPDKVSRFINNYAVVEKKILEVQEKDKLRDFQSPVRGDEIMEICNLKPSKNVGIIKSKIEEAILEGIIPNEYEAAKDYLYKIKDEILKN